jgi:hypothetical protein
LDLSFEAKKKENSIKIADKKNHRTVKINLTLSS